MDPEKDHKMPSAVHARRFRICIGDPFERRIKHQKIRAPETCIVQDNSLIGIVNIQQPHDADGGSHRSHNGQDHRHHGYDIENAAEFCFEFTAEICRKDFGKYVCDRTAEGIHKRVNKLSKHARILPAADLDLHILDGILEIFQRQSVFADIRQPENIMVVGEIVIVFQRRDDGKKQKINDDERVQDKNRIRKYRNKIPFFHPLKFFLCHGLILSRSEFFQQTLGKQCNRYGNDGKYHPCRGCERILRFRFCAVDQYKQPIPEGIAFIFCLRACTEKRERCPLICEIPCKPCHDKYRYRRPDRGQNNVPEPTQHPHSVDLRRLDRALVYAAHGAEVQHHIRRQTEKGAVNQQDPELRRRDAHDYGRPAKQLHEAIFKQCAENTHKHDICNDLGEHQQHLEKFRTRDPQKNIVGNQYTQREADPYRKQPLPERIDDRTLHFHVPSEALKQLYVVIQAVGHIGTVFVPLKGHDHRICVCPDIKYHKLQERND